MISQLDHETRQMEKGNELWVSASQAVQETGVTKHILCALESVRGVSDVRACGPEAR
jgi:hypothetical protein